MIHVIAYDFGTTGVKTCLFGIEDHISLITSAYKGYELFILDNGGAEQDADEWWQAMCLTTKEIFMKTDVRPDQIAGISFCSQMQGMVLVDDAGNALRRPMSYMDQRGTKEFSDVMGKGLIKISGCDVFKLLKNLKVNNAAPTSVKDPIWKYKWVENNEPEVFAKAHKWLDVKEYLIARCTGEFVMTKDSAFATFLYDTRKGHEGWNDSLVKLYGIKKEHLPRLIGCSDEAGRLTEQAAKELGLEPGTPVFGGGGDATLIGVGAGCTEPGQTHVYVGTSGWVSTVLDKQVVDVDAMIAGVVGAEDGRYNYFAEMETAGKSFEWVKDHVVLDEIDVYLSKIHVAESEESTYVSIYDYLSDEAMKVPAGSGGVIFTPWLHGNRCPFEDPAAAGIFFNVKIDTSKAQVIRAVLEGTCYHLRWMLECESKKVPTSDVIRFVGGGALSPLTCQILADVTGRTVEVVEGTQDVGAVGAAMLVAVGTKTISSLSEAGKYVKVSHRHVPRSEDKAVYDRNYRVFQELYKNNKKSFQVLNQEV